MTVHRHQRFRCLPSPACCCANTTPPTTPERPSAATVSLRPAAPPARPRSRSTRVRPFHCSPEAARSSPSASPPRWPCPPAAVPPTRWPARPPRRQPRLPRRASGSAAAGGPIVIGSAELPGERADRQHLRRGAQGQGRRRLHEPEHRQPRGLHQGAAGRLHRPGPGVHRRPAAVLRHDRHRQSSSDDVYTALQAKLPAGLTVLDKSAAEDKDAIVVTKETADANNLKSHRRPGTGRLRPSCSAVRRSSRPGPTASPVCRRSTA